jgi:hypothetical protein
MAALIQSNHDTRLHVCTTIRRYLDGSFLGRERSSLLGYSMVAQPGLESPVHKYSVKHDQYCLEDNYCGVSE